MGGDDFDWRDGVALVVSGLFLLAQIFTYANTGKLIEEPLAYPIPTMCFGYLLGYKFMANDRAKK